MKIILQKPVDKLGNPGDVTEVADGYARNYLIPRGLAIRAEKGARKHAESLQRAYVSRTSKQKTEYEAIAAKLIAAGALQVEARAGDEGKLFGSVTGVDIAGAIEAQTGVLGGPSRRPSRGADPLHRHPRGAGQAVPGRGARHHGRGGRGGLALRDHRSHRGNEGAAFGGPLVSRESGRSRQTLLTSRRERRGRERRQIPLCTFVHMPFHMGKTQVRARVTKNLPSLPAVLKSTAFLHCEPAALRAI